MSKLSCRKIGLVLFSALLIGGYGYSATSSNSGIDMYSGDIKMHGNDILDRGTKIWDASNSYIPSSQVQDAWINENGDTLKNSLKIDYGKQIVTDKYGSLGDVGFIFGDVKVDGNQGELVAKSSGGVMLESDVDSSAYKCWLSEVDGSWNCDGSKNWVQNLNTTHDAYYSSQESPQVRAVYENNTIVTNGRVNATLPTHFEKTVSDKKPMLRVQATPHELATVAVTARSDSWLVIESSRDVKVDYRITGIREGYEDKDVVRRKSEQ